MAVNNQLFWWHLNCIVSKIICFRPNVKALTDGAIRVRNNDWKWGLSNEILASSTWPLTTTTLWTLGWGRFIAHILAPWHPRLPRLGGQQTLITCIAPLIRLLIVRVTKRTHPYRYIYTERERERRPQSWDRGIIEEEALCCKHGGGIIEDDTWRNHEGEIIEEGGVIMEEE